MEAAHFEYDGMRYIGSFAPLFVHQYSQAWFDFRNKRDKFADYFQNSMTATEVHRRFCLELSKQFPGLQRRIVGNHRLGFAARIRGLGRAASHGADRRNGGAERGWGDRCLFLPAETLRVLRDDAEQVSVLLDEVWIS